MAVEPSFDLVSKIPPMYVPWTFGCRMRLYVGDCERPLASSTVRRLLRGENAFSAGIRVARCMVTVSLVERVRAPESLGRHMGSRYRQHGAWNDPCFCDRTRTF